MFLITGGDSDPQLICLIKRAALHGTKMHALLTGQSGTPRINWDIKANTLNDGPHTLKPTAAFIRQDVFTYLQNIFVPEDCKRITHEKGFSTYQVNI